MISTSLQQLDMREGQAKLREGWRIVRFGDVARNIQVNIDPQESGLERYVAGEHMETDNLHIRQWGTIGDGYLGPAFHRKFVKGQVLYGSRRTYLRKVAVAEFDGICANTTFTLESNEDELLQDLLPFIMQTETFTEHSIKQSRGSVNPYINWKDLAWYEFALPPKDEQRRIADILWAVDENVNQLNRCIQQAERLRRLVLSQVILKGLNHKEYQDTNIGRIPVSWRLARVEEVGKVQLGRQRAPQYQTGAYLRPYLRVANVFDGYLDLEDVLQMDFDEQDFEKYMLRSGDILLNEGQSRELVGRSCIYHGEIEGCCFQNTLIRYQTSAQIIPEYIFGYFQHAFYQGIFAQIARQTTSIAHLGADRFANLLIPIPPISEQLEIVKYLNTVNQSCNQLKWHADITENLKNRLLNQMLSHG